MNLENKKVIVIGIGLSGISACILLKNFTPFVTISDNKSIENIDFDLTELENLGVNIITGKNPDDIILDYDLIVVSPGVPFTLPFLVKAKEHNIEIIPEIELSYYFLKGNIVGITGTNGKTTTTDLTYNIFKENFSSVFLSGNIGIPLSDKVLESTETSYFITELSSYMLEKVDTFHCNIAIVLNVTEDHMLRHKTMENYAQAKKNITKNQTIDDFLILNYDDAITRSMAENSLAKVLFFTITDDDTMDMYIKDNFIYENITGKNQKLIDIRKIKILGVHNLYNIMASAIASLCANIDKSKIVDVIENYMGVAHRIEFVKDIENVLYYNDSKATNVDASLCAINAMVRPTILIAGGDEKNVALDDLVLKIKENVKFAVFVGLTKTKLANLCEEYGYENFYVANDYIEAVNYAKNIAINGDCVLLSPACASFDMFKNYECRGDYFKELVTNL